MHRQVSALLSAGGSPGKLAQLGEALGARGISVKNIGGTEWKHFGPVLFVLHEAPGDPEDQFQALAEVMAELQFPWACLRTIEVELEDKEGQLGASAAALGDANINIYGVEVIGRHGNNAVVGYGVLPGEVRRSVQALTDAGFTAKRAKHPDDPDDDGVSDPPPWWDRWDDRTMGFVDLWEDDGVAPDDPRFWQLI